MSSGTETDAAPRYALRVYADTQDLEDNLDTGGESLGTFASRSAAEDFLRGRHHPQLETADHVVILENGMPVAWWIWTRTTGDKREGWLEAVPGQLDDLREHFGKWRKR